MRFGIGLISILIAMALMLWLMVGTGYLKSVAGARKQANTQVNTWSGKSEDGRMLATDSIRYKVVSAGNRSKLIVTSIYRTGPMDEKYGLRKDDQIIEIGPLDVPSIITSRDDATAYLHKAYADNMSLTVLRGGKKITMPTPEHVAEILALKKAAALAATTQAAADAQKPTPPPVYQPGTLEKVIDSLWD